MRYLLSFLRGYHLGERWIKRLSWSPVPTRVAWHMFPCLLSGSLCLKIAGLKASRFFANEKVYWGHPPYGEETSFSVKSAYTLLVGAKTPTESKWDKVLEIKIHSFL